MNRVEYIEHLRKLHNRGGFAALRPAVDAALEREGPIHEPVWVSCARCPTLIELRPVRVWCDGCALARHADVVRFRASTERRIAQRALSGTAKPGSAGHDHPS